MVRHPAIYAVGANRVFQDECFVEVRYEAVNEFRLHLLVYLSMSAKKYLPDKKPDTPVLEPL